MHDFQLVTLTLNLFFTHLYFAVHRPLYTRTNSQRASDTVGAWLPWLTNRSWVTDWWEAVTWLALYVRAATESDVSDHRHPPSLSFGCLARKSFCFRACATTNCFFVFVYACARASLVSTCTTSRIYIRVQLRAHTPCVKLLNTYERRDRTRLCPRKRRSVWRLHSVLLVYLFFSYNSF